MKRIKNISTAGTVISMLSITIYIVLALIFYFFVIDIFMDFAGVNMDKLELIDPNSPSAGFEVLGHFAGGTLGLMGGLVAFVIVFFLACLFLYQLPAVISGLIANHRYKKSYPLTKCITAYKADAYIKAIMNGLAVLLALFMIAGSIGPDFLIDTFFILAIFWNFIAVFILSIFQLKAIAFVETQIIYT